jgi:hypothetical protein
MYLSDKYKFIFIRPQKIGGTSLGSAIFKLDKDAFQYKKEDKPQIENILNHGIDPYHITSADIKKIISKEKYNSYFKFSFTRNPWARMVSLYEYFHTLPHQSPQIKNKTFNKFLIEANSTWWYGAFDNHTDFIGNIDFIGKIENLQNDFDYVCEKIVAPKIPIPHKNATKHKHYTEYYDEETKSIVAKKYAKDIEYFGYKFGE